MISDSKFITLLFEVTPSPLVVCREGARLVTLLCGVQCVKERLGNRLAVSV